MATVEELEQKVTALETKLEVLEDIIAIMDLKGRYLQIADSRQYAKDDADRETIATDMANLFTEDAVWDGSPLSGIYQGRQAIYEHFEQGAAFTFAVHYFVAPDITVEGDRAHARWFLWQAATRRDNTPVWQSAFEDDDYIKINGQWLQSHMKLTINFLTPYDQGWVKKKIIT